ncbi:nucleotidyl transferase AbiEii/AbiGii toxin family protein [Nocardia fusca]|uniref:Nucleotidyl transferase AbiEii/AbiGii toxin family protein n=1 Tax=Nocardia fusca TaxID=941183 RepID=A0ABV3FFC6_9NOCA
MDPRQHELARIALQTVGRRGFVLGGGHAVMLHGMGTRPSEDVDLFSDVRGTPGEVADDVIASFESAGHSVTIVRRTPDLVQLTVTYQDGYASKVDLGVFWRSQLPVLLEVGPVLHPDDAVAGKMDALFNRWAPRDYLDIEAILGSGRYSPEQLITIAAAHDGKSEPPVQPNGRHRLRRSAHRIYRNCCSAGGEVGHDGVQPSSCNRTGRCVTAHGIAAVAFRAACCAGAGVGTVGAYR